MAVNIDSRALTQFRDDVRAFDEKLREAQRMYDSVMENKGFDNAVLNASAEDNRAKFDKIVTRFSNISAEIQQSITKTGQLAEAGLENVNANLKV